MPLSMPNGTPPKSGRLPWENSATGNTPTFRSGPIGDARPFGDKAVLNVLQAEEPVPMGQADPSKSDVMADRFAHGLKSSAHAFLPPQRLPASEDGQGYFPQGDPRNDPDVLDPLDVNEGPRISTPPRTRDSFGRMDRPSDDRAPPRPIIEPTLDRDMPTNPFQGMDESQLQTLLQQLQAILGGGSRPGPYLGPPVSPPFNPNSPVFPHGAPFYFRPGADPRLPPGADPRMAAII